MSEQNLSPRENEHAIQLYADHKKAVDRLTRLDDSYKTAVTVDDINWRSREEHAAPDRHDANLWHAHGHYQQNQEAYVEQARQEAQEQGIQVHIGEMPHEPQA